MPQEQLLTLFLVEQKLLKLGSQVESLTENDVFFFLSLLIWYFFLIYFASFQNISQNARPEEVLDLKCFPFVHAFNFMFCFA